MGFNIAIALIFFHLGSVLIRGSFCRYTNRRDAEDAEESQRVVPVSREIFPLRVLCALRASAISVR